MSAALEILKENCQSTKMAKRLMKYIETSDDELSSLSLSSELDISN